MAIKITAKEILTDPKYSEQKGMLKELITGIAQEITEEEKKKPRKKKDINIFDELFGGGDDDNED